MAKFSHSRYHAQAAARARRIRTLDSVWGFCFLLLGFFYETFPGERIPLLIAAKLALSVTLLIILWLPMMNHSRSSRILLSIILPLYFAATALLPWKAASFLLTLLFLLMAGRMLFLLFAFRKEQHDLYSGFAPTFVLLAHLIMGLTNTVPVSDETSLTLVTIPLILGIIAGLLLGLCYLHKSPFQKRLSRLGILLLSLMLCSVAFCALAQNGNTVLDRSAPTKIIAVVEGKQRIASRSRKRRSFFRKYRFSLRTDEKAFRMSVSKTEYNQYEEGDFYPLYRCEGAFGEPYYVPAAFLEE